MPPSFVESDTLWVATVSDPDSDLEAPLSSPTVLVVDDEHDVVSDLAMTLRDLGYEVATACNGADAIDRALSLRPALVITDVLMPVGRRHRARESPAPESCDCRGAHRVVERRLRGERACPFQGLRRVPAEAVRARRLAHHRSRPFATRDQSVRFPGGLY
jgi:CheY-like chemotaxis protein